MSGQTDGPARKPNAEFAAPLGATAHGRLVFASGASGITITVDATMCDLYRAHFELQTPSIHTQEGVVTVRYRRQSRTEWLAAGSRALGAITLNGSIPWAIEIRGDVSNLTADLRGLCLRALDLGNASQSALTLPRPVGAAYIYVSGSVSNVAIHRPANVALRVRIGRSASNVWLDEHFFGAVADGVRWETPSYRETENRYEISISGSASNVTIDALTAASPD